MPPTPETSPPLTRVRELPAGDKITGFYMLTKLETKPKRDGTSYAVFHLQDASARIEAKMWEGFEKFAAAAKSGDVLKVEATVDHYRDVPGLVISRVRLATPEEALAGVSCLRKLKSRRPHCKASCRHKGHVESVESPDYRLPIAVTADPCPSLFEDRCRRWSGTGPRSKQ